MIVQAIAADLTEVAGLIDPQNDEFEEALETIKHVGGRDVGAVPGADGILQRLEDRVLAAALRAAKRDAVIDFHLRVLDPVRHPSDDVIGVFLAIEPDKLQPAFGFGWVAG